MGFYRIYIDKKITEEGGGEHSRILDVEADSLDEAAAQLVLEDDEMYNSIAELAWDPR